MKKSMIVFGAVAAAMFATTAQAGKLDDVKARGILSCGVSGGVPGFSNPDDKNNWTGIDVDACRAVAAAVLGDASKVSYKPLTAKERWTALQSGEIDMLARNSTWTLSRDTSLGVNFTGVNYYDGQGFMVMKTLGVDTALGLDGATVCLQAGTTTELNLADYFRQHGMKYSGVVTDTSAQTLEGFLSGRCDILSSDQSQLYALRTKMENPDAAVVLPEIISKEPLGPVVSQGDDQWFNIVKWSHNAMLNAEELGITSANVDDLKANTTNPEIKRVLGTEGEAGTQLGLDADWAYRIVKQVGNYGEAFERNVGMGSDLKIARGLNALWNKGGLQYAPPIR